MWGGGVEVDGSFVEMFHEEDVADFLVVVCVHAVEALAGGGTDVTPDETLAVEFEAVCLLAATAGVF